MLGKLDQRMETLFGHTRVSDVLLNMDKTLNYYCFCFQFWQLSSLSQTEETTNIALKIGTVIWYNMCIFYTEYVAKRN